MSTTIFSDLTPAQQEATMNGPALTPPHGVEPNFDHPSNMNAGAQAIISICFIVTTLLVVIRFWVRILMNKHLKDWRVEDFLMFFAYGLYVGIVYILYRMTINLGFFVHQWDVQWKNMSEYLYLIHVMSNLYIGVVMSLKAAIILEWVSVFVPKGVRNTFFWVYHGLLSFNVLFYLSVLVAINLRCRPFRRIWELTIEGKCYDIKYFELTSATINLVSDMLMLLLPQRVIWRLQMSKPKKIGVSIVFAIGLLAVVSGALRLYSAVMFYKSPDSTYLSSSFSLWTLAEMTLIFVILCVPSLVKFWNNVWAVSTINQIICSWVRLAPCESAHLPNISSGRTKSPWPCKNRKASGNIYHRQTNNPEVVCAGRPVALESISKTRILQDTDEEALAE
ncbi:hypothetical protein PT974_12467 [Cladobotryum mycophilum]|uniref:Rhodopsin domain-containing protein n=1 Tax=Cladobotryum mycophilum TaxID=491253 RepID=A0ABR0S808_9HYPO